MLTNLLLILLVISEVATWVYRVVLEFRCAPHDPWDEAPIHVEHCGPFTNCRVETTPDSGFTIPVSTPPDCKITPLTPTLTDNLNATLSPPEMDETDFIGPDGRPYDNKPISARVYNPSL